MVGVMDTCVLQQSGGPSLQEGCSGPKGSAAALLESTLGPLEAAKPSPDTFTLGYTLPVPLLQMFKAQQNGWQIDAERVQRIVNTVRDNPRPLVLYLFSTHFSAHAPLEEALARDPDNLAQTRDGLLPVDQYYGAPIYPWSVARTDNSLTQRREEAMRAVLGALCQLPPKDLRKIRGVTLLGELHHLFPDFQVGMGFAPPYRITDYSRRSAQDFQRFLQEQFHQISRLNRVLGAHYTDFNDIQPPSRDIRSEPLQTYLEHIDAYAHGILPVAGWAFVPHASPDNPPWIHVYRNGSLQGKTRANQGRQDVLQAKPELGNANTGWRLDLDYRQWPAGVHRIDIFIESTPGRLTPLGTREVAIMDRQQSTPAPRPQAPLPASHIAPEGMQGHIDMPSQQAAFYYNPLVPLWHTFRERQVVRYLRHFNDVADASCLRATPRYTHQIIPFTNPGWDANKFAIDASLHPAGAMRLGVSLYGDATYGPGFPAWLRTTGQPVYGVTEFHPLKAMEGPELAQTLAQHARQGAAFVSFFLEPYWQGQRLERSHNPFAFDPQNSQYGSQALYEAAKGLGR